MPGRVATVGAVLSLVLCAATAVLWVRARRTGVAPDRLALSMGEGRVGVRCDRNKIVLIGPPPTGRPGDVAEARAIAGRLRDPKHPPPTDSDARGLSADVREEGWSFLPAPVPTAPLLKAMEDPRRFVSAQIELERVTRGGGFIAPSIVASPAGDGGSESGAAFTSAEIRSVVGQWHDLLGVHLGSIPYAIILGLTLILPARFGWHIRRHRRRKRLHLCLGCGYDLQASPLRCPECGRPVSGTSPDPDADEITAPGPPANSTADAAVAHVAHLSRRRPVALLSLALMIFAGIGGLVLIAAVRPAPTGDDDGSFAEQTRRDEERMERIFRAIRHAADSGAWQTPGWQDAALEADLADVIAQTCRTAGIANLALPVEFSKVQPVLDVTEVSRSIEIEGVLCVAKDDCLNIGFAKGSILLIDGNFDVIRAENCIIVASGAVEISSGQGNVVLAGHYLQVTHEGNLMLRASGTRDSILITGSVIDISSAHGTVCSAPRLVRISNNYGGKLVDVPVTDPTDETAVKRTRRARFTVAAAPKPNPLKGVLRIISTSPPLYNRPARTARAVLSDGSELTLRIGTPIIKEDVSPAPALAEWRTSIIDDGYVLLSNGQERAEFFAPTDPP